MLDIARLALVFVLASALSVPSWAGDDDEPPFVPREAVVRLVEGVDAIGFASEYDSRVLASLTARNIHILSVPLPFDEDDFTGIIENDPRVLSVELNFIGEDVNPDGNTQSIFIARDADAFINQGAIDVIRADDAHSRALGAGVIVAVLDSGYDPAHPVFRGRTPISGVDLVDGDNQPLDVGDNVDNDGDKLVDEMVGHGTLVASIVLRVAPEATILPIRVLDSDGGSTNFRLIDGIYTAVDRGADIINISLGTLAESQQLRAAIDEARAAGVLIIAAAGNDAADQARYPAGFSGPGAVSVAATTNADIVAEFSNFGEAISFTAPGDPVVGATPGGQFGSARGTSFSAPLVAGAAALLRSITPCVPMSVIESRLAATAVDIDKRNPDFVGMLGAGRIDAAAAVGIGSAPPIGVADRNGDRRVDMEDLYIQYRDPMDLNGDGEVNLVDRHLLETFVRRFERYGF